MTPVSRAPQRLFPQLFTGWSDTVLTWTVRGGLPVGPGMTCPTACCCGSPTSGLKGLTPPVIGSIGTVVSIGPGTGYVSRKKLERHFQLSTSFTVERTV